MVPFIDDGLGVAVPVPVAVALADGTTTAVPVAVSVVVVDGLAPVDALGDGVIEADADDVMDGLAPVEADADGDTDGDAVMEGLALTEGERDAVFDGDAPTDAVGVCVGVKRHVPTSLHVHPLVGGIIAGVSPSHRLPLPNPTLHTALQQAAPANFCVLSPVKRFVACEMLDVLEYGCGKYASE